VRATPLAALLLVLAPALAGAQGFDGTQGMDTYTGPVISPARILGLGGAYVAVAEGLAGALENPAAVAQRNRHLARGWDWDGLLTWYLPDPREVGSQDLGNDGRSDGSLSGIGNVQLGLSLQRGRFGVGLFGRGWTVAAPRGGLGPREGLRPAYRAPEPQRQRRRRHADRGLLQLPDGVQLQARGGDAAGVAEGPR